MACQAHPVEQGCKGMTFRKAQVTRIGCPASGALLSPPVKWADSTCGQLQTEVTGRSCPELQWLLLLQGPSLSISSRGKRGGRKPISQERGSAYPAKIPFQFRAPRCLGNVLHDVSRAWPGCLEQGKPCRSRSNLVSVYSGQRALVTWSLDCRKP